MSVIRRENVVGTPLFQFRDVERQAQAIIARAKSQAEQMVAEARKEVAETQRQIKALKEARRREGFEQGMEEGRQAGLVEAKKEARADALKEARNEIHRLSEALAAGLERYEQNKHHLLAVAETGLIELALAIARRVCRIAVENSPESARANARALLQLVRHTGDAELRFNPVEHELLCDVATELHELTAQLGHVTIKPDPAVERGACVLHAAEGTINASISEQLDRIALAICGSTSAGRLQPGVEGEPSNGREPQK